MLTDLPRALRNEYLNRPLSAMTASLHPRKPTPAPEANTGPQTLDSSLPHGGWLPGGRYTVVLSADVEENQA